MDIRMTSFCCNLSLRAGCIIVASIMLGTAAIVVYIDIQHFITQELGLEAKVTFLVNWICYGICIGGHVLLIVEVLAQAPRLLTIWLWVASAFMCVRCVVIIAGNICTYANGEPVFSDVLTFCHLFRGGFEVFIIVVASSYCTLLMEEEEDEES